MNAMYRILYVDDEPALLEVGRIFLEQSGEFSVVSIESATAALALLKREQFDAIVSDYEMPGMNGIEFLTQVRASFGKIPFIIFTGKGGEEEVIQAINKGADYYLQKGGEPVLMFVDLSHKIRQAVTGRRADEALRESELRYRSLFENMLEGFAYCKMLYDIEEHPVDFIYITVNPAFDRILGTTAIAGKLVTEVFPGIKENFPSMFEIYGRVALNGEPESFDLDFQPSKKWLHISVYSPAKEYFVAVFYDITERKLAEETLRNLTRELEFRVLQRTAELELEIVHRKAAEETITASLNEKEILLREIHHRVKNNLQIITSLIRLHYRQITDPGTIHALQDSESRIRSMALVHEKLYRSTDLANIDFTDYIRSLTTSLITAYATDPHRIRLVIDVKDVSLDINRAIPVGLIMNELVANALKHAFPEGLSGIITITGRRTPAGIILSVQDNGVGLPEGLDWRNTTTLGLHLIVTLIRQVNGSIELNCNGGTAFEMFIPSVIKETSS